MVDRLIICGDFNLPGTSPDTINNGLAELLHSTSFTQFVKSPTRYDAHHDRSSLLDLIITPTSSKLVTTTSVVSSHEISDHDLTCTNLNTKRYKSPQRIWICIWICLFANEHACSITIMFKIHSYAHITGPRRSRALTLGLRYSSLFYNNIKLVAKQKNNQHTNIHV